MINDLKIAMKLQKFGFQAKMQMGFMGLFFLIGLALEILLKGTYFLGGFFIVLSPMYFCQILYGLGMSQMIASSPYKKRMQTTMPVIGNLFLSTICITILWIVKLLIIRKYPENESVCILLLLTAAVMSLIFNAYCAMVYKYYAVSMIILMVPLVIFSGINGANMGMGKDPLGMGIVLHINFGTAVILSYVIALLGCVIQYGLSCLVYRKPLSEYAQGMMMRKYLKG